MRTIGVLILSAIVVTAWASEPQAANLRFVDCQKAISESMLVVCPQPNGFAPPEQYVIFFGEGDASLSDDARAGIAEIAAALKTKGGTAYISGYTDTHGDSASNLTLSKSRAQTVASELVRLGTKDSQIAPTKAFGETHLAVETGDNVEEPRNNRATVIVASD